MNFLPIVVSLVLCWIRTCHAVLVEFENVDDYDPGTCDRNNVLHVYSVNDKNGEKKLWICSKEKGKYLWKPVDGGTSRGEYLSPGEDCSDILDHEQDADDGFYWVRLKGDNTIAKRVWCDMKTDGGGYMLVARKHDAITWDIPSKDKTVYPNSTEKFWTSQLGNAPILDFRIQLSTKDSFTGTKAHWSYRLKKMRPLKQLMITDRGCGTNSPGIGDIAYVKDLMTGKIVTTVFECSVFGVAHSKTVGWARMNECLERSCSKGSGYFNIHGYEIQFDETGVFSYSVSDKISGYNNQATSYIGCDHQTCCGCFSPTKGGTANYCDSQCNPINGGIIVDPKKIYTWVWVRPSLPKRIWNRCMEYQSQDENGQLQWYKLVGDSAIPQEGRCPGSVNPRLNSGVVVVPDNATAKKVPGIPGLLEYRQDQKKLYVRANKTWNLLTQEKEVKGKLIQLEESMDARYAELKQKIEAGDAELEENLKLTIKNYNKIVEGCNQYKWLNESDRRYDHHDSSNQKCDNNLAGWYRFGGSAGTQMYTSCPSNYACNTYYPGYMSGGHPDVNDGIVTRTVHFHEPAYGTCPYSRSIEVINCVLYYVYKLNGVAHCPGRYCST